MSPEMLLKKVIILLLSLVVFNFCFSQKKFSLTIYADSTIDIKKLKFYCNGGKANIYPSDTFRNGKQVMHGEYYSRYVTVTVYYQKAAQFYYKQYWIQNKPAKLILSDNDDKSKDKNFFYKASAKNMSDVLQVNSELKNRLNDFIKVEANEISNLWSNEVLQKNRIAFDSIDKILFIKWFEKSSEFIKAHNTHYFYFWHFKDQFYERIRTRYKNDTALLVRVRDSFVSIFPEQIVSSFEGKRILNEVEAYIRPKTGILSPLFKVEDMNGVPFDLKHYRGKFVLLDFWASWCPPCIKQIPFVKGLRSDFSNDILEIVGVNTDTDYKKATQLINSMGMNWRHIYDKDKELSNLFSIEEIPVLILINREGQIIYDSRSGDGNKNELLKLLNQNK